MEVILLADVKGVGKKDQTVNVSDGYANNFLLKKHLAVKVSKKSVEILGIQQENARIAEENAIEDAKKLAKELENIEIVFTLKAGKEGKPFGSISTKQIEEELFSKHKIKIDRHKFIDKGPFNIFGYYQLKIELYRGVIGNIKVHIGEEK